MEENKLIAWLISRHISEGEGKNKINTFFKYKQTYDYILKTNYYFN